MQAFLVESCKPLVAACGIQFPDQGSNPGLLCWESNVLATGPQGESQKPGSFCRRLTSFQCPDHRLCVRPGAQDWVCLSLGARNRRLVLKVASERCDPAASVTQDPQLDPQEGRVQPWSRRPGGAQVPTCDFAPSGRQPPAADLRDAEALSPPSHLGVSLSCPPIPIAPGLTAGASLSPGSCSQPWWEKQLSPFTSGGKEIQMLRELGDLPASLFCPQLPLCFLPLS